jgi:hypothetical protein
VRVVWRGARKMEPTLHYVTRLLAAICATVARFGVAAKEQCEAPRPAPANPSIMLHFTPFGRNADCHSFPFSLPGPPFPLRLGALIRPSTWILRGDLRNIWAPAPAPAPFPLHPVNFKRSTHSNPLQLTHLSLTFGLVATHANSLPSIQFHHQAVRQSPSLFKTNCSRYGLYLGQPGLQSFLNFSTRFDTSCSSTHQNFDNHVRYNRQCDRPDGHYLPQRYR